MPAVRAVGHVQVGKLSVIFVSDKKKEVTKTQLVAYFGKEQAEAFWETIESKVSEYLTVGEVKSKATA